MGRIICYAIEDGATAEDVRKEAERCIELDRQVECDDAFNLLRTGAAVLEAVGLLLLLLVPLAKAARAISRIPGVKKVLPDLTEESIAAMERLSPGIAREVVQLLRRLNSRFPALRAVQ